MNEKTLAVLIAVFCGIPHIVRAERKIAHVPNCTQLQAEIVSDPAIKSVRSSIVPASASDASYCEVRLTYSSNPKQKINIVVVLPLSAIDGGKGGVQGAWNGRTQGLGGGGCTGNLLQSPYSLHKAVINAGYVASGNDLGHSGDSCEPGVNPDGTYNMQFIEDFFRNGVIQQVLWSKSIAKRYYGQQAQYNYWNGCSTGGRQGYQLAQDLGGELQGILADDPAINWTRFSTAQMWGQIAMHELVGGPIAPEKLEQARVSSVAACDASDGIKDGIIGDPHTCEFSAQANVCGSPTAPAANCLTSKEAIAVDMIWDGPRNAAGNKIWFGLDRGSSFATLNGPTPIIFGPWTLKWAEKDRNLDWTTVSLARYPQIALHGSQNIADVSDTSKPLDAFRASGGKLLTVVSLNDSGIFPRGVIHYYRQMAARYSQHGTPDFENVQGFYRLFSAPGVDHCGGGAGPYTSDAFSALVDWVEHRKPPQSLLAVGNSAASASGRTRPLCPYPQQALYNGIGSTDDASNFRCGGTLETTSVVCADVLTKYKDEKNGALDFFGTGVSSKECLVAVRMIRESRP